MPGRLNPLALRRWPQARVFGWMALTLAVTLCHPSPCRSANSAATPPATPAATVRVAGIVLKWLRADKEANYRRAERWIRQAAAGGARIVCTTECFLDGYAIKDKSIPLEDYRALGEPIRGGRYFRLLAVLADELDIYLYLVAGMLEADGPLRHNTAVILDPRGRLVGKYRKRKLQHELAHNTAGTEPGVFATEFGKVGLIICADRTEPRFVEETRRAGSAFILCPSGGMFGPRSNDPILQARSRESGQYIVFVHPAEFLVTGPDGAICRCQMLGDRLEIARADIGSPADTQGMFFFDLSAAGSP